MRTFTSNLIVLSAVANDTTITGKAFDRDISINYSVNLNDLNQVIFVPEANLVVTGSLRIDNKEIASVNIWINNTIAVVSLPEPEVIDAPAELVEAMAEILDAPVEAVAEIINAPHKVLQTQAEAVAEVIESPVKTSKKTSTRKKAVIAEAEAELIAL